MDVEIYSEQEFKVGEENDPDRILLMAELGLSQDQAEGRNRFRKMYEEECFVFGVLFPHVTRYQDYKGYLPTRVLKEIRDYKVSNIEGKEILILCPNPGDVDPVVVASKYTWHSQVFSGQTDMIARFGDALEDFATLRNRAFERMAEKFDHLEALPMATLANIAEKLFAT